jgi:hypothetical protein
LREENLSLKKIKKWGKWLIGVLVTLGLIGILGQDFYQEHIRDHIYQPIVTNVDEITFNRESRFSKRVFYVTNRSGKPRFDVFVRVFLGNLDKKTEVFDLEIVKENKNDGNDTKEAVGGFDIKELLAPIAKTDFALEGDYVRIVGEEKEFALAYFKKLESMESREVAVKYRSILKPETVKQGDLVLPVEIWRYGFGGIGEVSNPKPNEMTLALHFPDKLDRAYRKLPAFMHCLVFGYFKGIPVATYMDVDEQGWFAAQAVCKILRIKEFHEYATVLKDSEKDTLHVSEEVVLKVGHPEYFDQETIVVSESGLDALFKKADKSTAKYFKEWLDKVLMPKLKDCVFNGDKGRQTVLIYPGR